MTDLNPATKSTQTLERILSSAAVALCLTGCLWIGQVVSRQQPVWPFPGLYLIEAGLVSVFCWLSVLYSGKSSAAYLAFMVWLAVGILAAFVIMGLWSIGPLFIPVSALFAGAGILIGRRQTNSILVSLGAFVSGFLAQFALMLFAIRFIG